MKYILRKNRTKKIIHEKGWQMAFYQAGSPFPQLYSFPDCIDSNNTNKVSEVGFVLSFQIQNLCIFYYVDDAYFKDCIHIPDVDTILSQMTYLRKVL